MGHSSPRRAASDALLEESSVSSLFKTWKSKAAPKVGILMISGLLGLLARFFKTEAISRATRSATSMWKARPCGHAGMTWGSGSR